METWHFELILSISLSFDKEIIIKFSKCCFLVKISKIWKHKKKFFRNLKMRLTIFLKIFFLKIEFYDVCHSKSCQKIRKLKKS